MLGGKCFEHSGVRVFALSVVREYSYESSPSLRVCVTTMAAHFAVITLIE